MDDAVRPFGIDIPQAELDDLRDRLGRYHHWWTKLSGPSGLPGAETRLLRG